jgi:hypothetical protein
VSRPTRELPREDADTAPIEGKVPHSTRGYPQNPIRADRGGSGCPLRVATTPVKPASQQPRQAAAGAIHGQHMIWIAPSEKDAVTDRLEGVPRAVNNPLWTGIGPCLYR